MNPKVISATKAQIRVLHFQVWFTPKEPLHKPMF